jgi:hypothetical protein
LNGTWTTVGSNVSNTISSGSGTAVSVFNYLPSIHGIKLDSATLPSTTEGVTNIDLSNVEDLVTFSI